MTKSQPTHHRCCVFPSLGGNKRSTRLLGPAPCAPAQSLALPVPQSMMHLMLCANVEEFNLPSFHPMPRRPTGDPPTRPCFSHKFLGYHNRSHSCSPARTRANLAQVVVLCEHNHPFQRAGQGKTVPILPCKSTSSSYRFRLSPWAGRPLLIMTSSWPGSKQFEVTAEVGRD